MKITVKDLKVGQQFRSATGFNPPVYTVHDVAVNGNTVVVIVNPDNPFVSSSFASYNINTIVEVI